MASVVATGVQGHALELLLRLVSSSSHFLARTKADSAEVAVEKHCYWPWLQEGEDLSLRRPCAILERGEMGYQFVAGGGRNEFLPGGSLLLTITDNDRYLDAPKDAEQDFLNFADGVILDIVEKAGEDDNLDIVDMQQVQKPMRSPPTYSGAPYWSTKWEIAWALGGKT